jgi:hypothetical protein
MKSIRQIRPILTLIGQNVSGGHGTSHSPAHTTPSFFCRLVDDVVYWNTRRLSGKT